MSRENTSPEAQGREDSRHSAKEKKLFEKIREG
jgi:hypothetical protein